MTQRKRLLMLLGILGLLSLAPTSLMAQIRGRVVADSTARLNHPIAVSLELDGVVFDTVFTNSIGGFIFDDLAGRNRVVIAVNEPGFKPVRMEVVAFPGGRGTPPPDSVVILEVLESGPDSPGDPGPVDLGELLSDIPDAAFEAYRQGAEHSENGDYDSAAESLEEAVEIAPDFYDAQNALGMQYQRLGRTDDAIRQYLMAIELNPNASAPALSLGVLYFQDNALQAAEGKLEEARASLNLAFGYLEDAVDRDPLSASAQYYLGAAHYKAGAIDNALDRFNRALGLDEDFHDVRIMLFNVYMAMRDFDAALDQLTTYLEVFPDSPQREGIERTKAALEEQLSLR
jgi:tetratricopeptide (TPR) repeat protein